MIPPVKNIRQLVDLYGDDPEEASRKPCGLVVRLPKIRMALLHPYKPLWARQYEGFCSAWAMCDVDGAEDPMQLLYKNYLDGSIGVLVAHAFISVALALELVHGEGFAENVAGLLVPGLDADEADLLFDLDLNEIVNYLGDDLGEKPDFSDRNAYYQSWQNAGRKFGDGLDEPLPHAHRMVSYLILLSTVAKEYGIDVEQIVAIVAERDRRARETAVRQD